MTENTKQGIGLPPVSRKILLLMCTMSFIMYLDRVNLSAAAGILAKELHLANTDMGIIFSAFAYTYLVFQIIGGWVSDKFGAKKVLVICTSIWVIATVATGLANGMIALILARMLLGVGEGMALPAQARAITNWFTASKGGFVQGLTHSCSRLGNAITPSLIAFIVVATSWRISFYIVALITAIWLIVFFWYFKDNPRTHPSMTEAEEKVLPPFNQQTITNEAAVIKTKTPWGAIIKRIAPSMLVYFCYGWTGWLFFTWIPTFFMNGRGLDIKSSAFFSTGVFLSGVVGNTVGGVLSDRILKSTGSVVKARRNVIILSFVGAFIFLIPVITMESLTVVAISLSIAFFFLEMTIGPIWAVPMDIMPKYVGISSGMVNAGSAVAGIFTPIIFGYIVDKTGSWTLPFAGSLVMLFIGVIATFFIRPDIKLNV